MRWIWYLILVLAFALVLGVLYWFSYQILHSLADWLNAIARLGED